jgi:5-methyltetrahydropteroyltriglutamate--homocysteine methyltransferase
VKHSTDRILTTHAGRLDGPPEYRETMMALMSGTSTDLDALRPKIHSAIVDVLRKQADAGIDVVSDGELGKIGFGSLGYYNRRMSGLTTRPRKADEPPFMSMQTGERLEFADFYKELAFMPTAPVRAVCSGPIAYIGQEEVKRDLAGFRAALSESGVQAEEAFMCVLSPGWLEHFFLNEYYSTDEEYLFALADAVKHEYKAVVDGGFLLQIDDPALPDTFDMIVPNPTIEEYRKFAAVRVEALNHALRGLPEDRIRYHICWGSWHGPHSHDLPLHHVVDLMLRITAGAYSLEAANPRHEHEWKIWQDVKLPEGKLLIPGVVTHHTNVIEHPELVADRIVRYADLVGRENVIAGTDCGMGFRVHPQIAWAKLKTLAEGANLASRRLWGAHTNAATHTRPV